MVRVATKARLATLIAACFIASAVYWVLNVYWYGAHQVSPVSIAFQFAKFLVGVLLILRQGFAPYLVLILMVWPLVALGMGVMVLPSSHPGIYMAFYVPAWAMLMSSIAVLMFDLRRDGYYKYG